VKRIRYHFLSHEVNHGTEESPDIEKVFQEKTVICTENSLEENLDFVRAEAYNGEYTIEDDGQPAPSPAGEPVTWEELDAAYQAGYNEGYTEGVNSAYDQ
jgi:hypothetical protein